MDSIKTIVSGMRPTGRLHLGHYHGVLANWIKLQGEVPCYFFVADLHCLTTDYENPSRVKEFSREMLLDWLSCGLDPEKSTLFVQSAIPEHSELHLLFSMLTPIGWLERVPSYKELRDSLKEKDLSTYGFLGYPVLQTADIALYRASHVPVGEDQVAHLELGREIIRRFHFLYKKEVFVEPKPLLTPAAKLPGLDARKMSKSYDNCIYLSDPPEAIERKLKPAFTDPKRLRRTDPGEPNDCNVYAYHRIYTGADERAEIELGCRSASMGCVDCKKRLIGKVNESLAPFAERRAKWGAHPNRLDEILVEGTQKARAVAIETLESAKAAMGL